MGILSGLLGNASEVDAVQVQQLLESQLVAGESIQRSYQVVRDIVTFTDRRIILIDKQGITGKRKTFTSIPYRSIVRYDITTTGHFDVDAELRLWLHGQAEVMKLEFAKNKDVHQVVQLITQHAC